MIELAAGEYFKEAGLAGPIGTGKTDNLCPAHLERDALENPSTTKVERDISAGQQGH